MNASLLRILDANTNRAREALRGLEDYARFGLNDVELAGALKTMRHELRAALEATLPQAALHRDTPADIGTTLKTAAEFDRADLADIVTAAGKRAGEALRTLEECCKAVAPPAALTIESLRYRLYSIEKTLLLTLRPPSTQLAAARLYVLITEASCAGRDWFAAASAAIDGGAQILQLREKELDGGELLSRATRLTALCRRRGVLCLINDRPDIALLADADGVHLGRSDLPAVEARKILGRDKLIGVSTHELAHAHAAVRDGADYIGVGPIFTSATKPRAFVAGLDYARQIAAARLPVPAFAIAGITLVNLPAVLGTGLDRVAITAACVGAPDISAVARQFREALDAATR